MILPQKVIFAGEFQTFVIPTCDEHVTLSSHASHHDCTVASFIFDLTNNIVSNEKYSIF
jgi:hypothetical protein